MIFGISGCSASGKSFIVDYLKKNISSSKVSFIYQDNYYKKREDQSKDENGNYNFDLPTSFLNDELVRDLNLLKNGDQVVRKEYNFNNPNIDQKKVEVLPRPIIILEGLFIFNNHNISRLLDHKIFVNASINTMLKRRIKRDSKLRGYDRFDVEYKFENHVIPAYKKYILPQRNKADFVVENDEIDNDAPKKVLKYIKNLISDHL